jgi:hypothetical protein
VNQLSDQLSEIILEIADQLDFLPIEKVSALISKMVIDILPYALLQISETSIPTRADLKSAEFRTLRTRGKSRDDMDEEIENRTSVYDAVVDAKSTMVTQYASHGSALVMVAMKDRSYPDQQILAESSLNNIVNRYMHGRELLDTMAEQVRTRPHFARLRANNLRYTVDEHTTANINKDSLFRIFCSTVEEAAREFAAVHKNEWHFSLQETRDPDSKEFQRTNLSISLTGISFDTSLKLWSTLGSLIRERLDQKRKYLQGNEQDRFKQLLSNFNVVLDY